MCFNSAYNLKVKTSGSADRLDMNCERNREVKNASSLVVLAYVGGSMALPFSKIRKTDEVSMLLGSGCGDPGFSF